MTHRIILALIALFMLAAPAHAGTAFLVNEVDTGMTKDTAVVPAIIGNSILCLQLSDRLKQRGINVQPILYPAVEESAARLRFFVSSLHQDEQLEKTAAILSEEYEKLKKEHAADAVA